MNLPELFKARGHEYYDQFHVIVKREEFDYAILKDGLTRQINQAPNQSAYQKAIANEYDMFFNKGVPQETFSRLNSVSELVRLGFELHKKKPFLTVGQIINRPDFKNGLIQFKSGVHYVRWLGEVEAKYKGESIDQLKDIDEIIFEAFHYLVVGGNFERVFQWLSDYVLNPKLRNSSKDVGEDKYSTLSEIFISGEAYLECINALTQVKKPIVSNDNAYLLGVRMKGVFSGWLELLRQRGKIKSVTNKTVASLLNREFKGLDLYSDGSNLSKTETTWAKKYYTQFQKIIK